MLRTSRHYLCSSVRVLQQPLRLALLITGARLGEAYNAVTAAGFVLKLALFIFGHTLDQGGY
jgi:hypothetical protein